MVEGESARTNAVRQVHEAALRRARHNFDPVVRENAEDIAQEAVVRYLEASRSQVIDDPAAWANIVAWRLAGRLSRARRAARPADPAGDGDRWDVPRAPVDPQQAAFVSFLADGRPTSAMAILREQADRLRGMLDEQETEFVLLVASGYSQAEIADILGYANANVVKATLNRKRRQLQAVAEDAHLDPDWQAHPRPYG